MTSGMMRFLEKRFSGKRILLLGLGFHGGGLATAKFLLRAHARLIVSDRKPRGELQQSIRELESFRRSKRFPTVTYRFGELRMRDITGVDGIVKNPGVRPDASILRMARRRGIPVYSDITLFFEACPAPIIGVTGTRGKSTTAFLIAALLSHVRPRRRVWLGGNIRKSVLSFLPRVTYRDFVVVELSSFQLMDLPTIRKSPCVAVLTNILRDHLNWHTNAREYQEAKAMIFRFQKSTDHVFIPRGDKILERLTRRVRSRVHRVALETRFRSIVARRIGEHYSSSVGLAVAVAKHFRVSHATIAGVLRRFHGLPYREEEIRTWNRIRFVNDTTATIPDATVAALRRFSREAEEGGGKVVLIAGGSDKKLDFRRFAEEAHRLATAIIFLPGDATDKMKRALAFAPRKGILRLRDARSMKEAVRRAVLLAKPGDIVLLSPGAASFGLFRNEFDRGDQFVREVKRLR